MELKSECLNSLQDWLAFIQCSHPSNIELGLDRVLAVWAKMKARKPGRIVITVGGTNGKGSTIAAIEAMLLSRGAKVGVYTSPHIHLYNERVRINGSLLEDEQLIEGFRVVERARGSIPLTYFEFGTLAALYNFTQLPLDVVLLEVGLGGRMDAVNIIDPDLSIVTSVDLDHMDWLGDNREDIGYEKAGIFRAGRHALYGESNPPLSVLQFANAQKVLLKVFGKDFGDLSEGVSDSSKGLTPVVIQTRSGPVTINLPESLLPRNNLIVAIQALATLGLDFSQDEINRVLGSLSVPGRMELLRESPPLMVDVGHNPHAARFIRSRLAALGKGRKIIAVYSSLMDKDSAGVFNELNEVIHEWHLVPLNCDRAKPMAQLTHELASTGSSFITHPSLNHALDLLTAHANDSVFILVFGSFYIVEGARDWMKAHSN
ncbi:MAG: bifunctional tetrahydrofolate synthase/dihydrofolate synthase [Hahellaceae bacterium]|nr:bifunctional tetrahydrofolate synthase/dihydrofolate synthase [Hahellaceae bacterium]